MASRTRSKFSAAGSKSGSPATSPRHNALVDDKVASAASALEDAEAEMRIAMEKAEQYRASKQHQTNSPRSQPARSNSPRSSPATPRTNLSNAYGDFKKASTPEDTMAARQRVVEARARVEAGRKAAPAQSSAAVARQVATGAVSPRHSPRSSPGSSPRHNTAENNALRSKIFAEAEKASGFRLSPRSSPTGSPRSASSRHLGVEQFVMAATAPVHKADELAARAADKQAVIEGETPPSQQHKWSHSSRPSTPTSLAELVGAVAEATKHSSTAEEQQANGWFKSLVPERRDPLTKVFQLLQSDGKVDPDGLCEALQKLQSVLWEKSKPQPAGVKAREWKPPQWYRRTLELLGGLCVSARVTHLDLRSWCCTLSGSMPADLAEFNQMVSIDVATVCLVLGV